MCATASGRSPLSNSTVRPRARSACTIAAVSDSRIEKAQKAADLYGCPAFADHRDMLELVDAVSIAVPTGDHYAVARDFLAAGIDDYAMLFSLKELKKVSMRYF